VWSILAFILLGIAAGVTWTAVEVALRNVSIGDVAPARVVGKWAGYFRVFPKKEERR
jgi:hypothetical protein